MNKSTKKIVALLAISDAKIIDIEHFISIAIEIGPRALANHVQALRESIERLPFDLHLHQESPDEHDTKFDIESDVARKISQLLFYEAGLSKSEAVERLTRELLSRHPLESLPAESRKGFSNWINRVSSIVSASEILHLATIIRNELVHNKSGDWRLR